VHRHFEGSAQERERGAIRQSSELLAFLVPAHHAGALRRWTAARRCGKRERPLGSVQARRALERKTQGLVRARRKATAENAKHAETLDLFSTNERLRSLRAPRLLPSCGSRVSTTCGIRRMVQRKF